MSTDAVTPLRHRMIEDMNARKLSAGTQRGHIHSCKRFAAFLSRSPDTATTEDIRRFQLHLAEAGVSICNRNRIMTGLRFLFRVTLRQLDLAVEIYHIREPQKIPLVMSQDETRRLLAVASTLKIRTLLSLGYGCGLRAGEVVRLNVKHIEIQMIPAICRSGTARADLWREFRGEFRAEHFSKQRSPDGVNRYGRRRAFDATDRYDVVMPAKLLAMTAIDLLHGDAAAAREIFDQFQPAITKDAHLALQRGLSKKERYAAPAE